MEKEDGGDERRLIFNDKKVPTRLRQNILRILSQTRIDNYLCINNRFTCHTQDLLQHCPA